MPNLFSKPGCEDDCECVYRSVDAAE